MKTALLLLATIFVVGCNSDDEFEPAVVPKTYSFQGNIDDKYAGTWKSTDGASTLDILKDGKVGITTVTRSQGGENKAQVDGKWLVDGDNLMFQYSDPNGTTVLKYKAKLDKGTLSLQPEGSKVPMTYKRS